MKPTISYFWLVVHLLLGVLVMLMPNVSYFWAVIPILVGIYEIITSRNKQNQAAFWAAYYVGLELMLRMTGGYITWEFGKYGTIILLGLGFIVEKRKYAWKAFWCVVMGALLLPGIFDTFAWSNNPLENVLFNTSGMVTLIAATGYFYKRSFTFLALKRMLSWFLLPIISTIVYLFITTPDIDTISFTTQANFDTSGGFGPNQVASVLGAGWVIVLVYYLYKVLLTPNRWVDLCIFVVILFRALFTFSRGGNYAAIIALFAFLAVHVLSEDSRLISKKLFYTLLVTTVCAVIAVFLINNATEGVFAYRYTGRNMEGEMRGDVTTGRLELLKEEWEIFKDNPLGVGAGGSTVFRSQMTGRSIATHNEFGRLLSEHGILGLAVIVMLIVYPIRHYFKWKVTDARAFLVLLCALSLATMMHSALRLALPAFLYGLSMVRLLPNDENSIYRQ